MEIPKSCSKCPELKTSNLQKCCYCALTEYTIDNPTNGRPYFCHYGPRYNAASTLPVTATEIKTFFDNFYGDFARGEKFIPSRPTPISQTSYKMGRGSIMNNIKPKRIIRQNPTTIIF